MDGKNSRNGPDPVSEPGGPEGSGSKTSSSQYRSVAFVIGICLVVCVVAAGVIMGSTSSTAFCLSCHEMARNQDELALSSHAKDYDGSPISCSQCHVPRGVGPKYVAIKTYSGVKDLYVHFVEAPQSLDRLELQPVARRFVDDASCIACHTDLYQDAKKKGPISELGKLAHDAYNGKDGKSYRNCVACHVNMAHLPNFDRRLHINKEFAAKLAASEQQGGAQ